MNVNAQPENSILFWCSSLFRSTGYTRNPSPYQEPQ